MSVNPEIAANLVQAHGSIKAASRAEKIGYGTVQKNYKKAVELGIAEPLVSGGANPNAGRKNSAAKQIGKAETEPLVQGRVGYRETFEQSLPDPGEVSRYIVTCAQNNTHLHEETWKNLNVLADYYDAKIMVSRFTYDLSTYGEGAVKPGTEKLQSGVWYDPRVEEYACDERVRLAPGLVWCGEMNILPTAVRPLSGFESYTGRESGIIPHVKLAMESVASHKTEATKFNYTTGTVTQRNYVQKKAGLKAEFHHCYGGLIVEVNSDGDWWVRQLNADSEGVIFDLGLRVHGGIVETNCPVEAITWGDIHHIRMDPEVEEASWGPHGMASELQPRYEFMHDILDFRSRNHHEAKDPHARFQRHVEEEDDVEQEVIAMSSWLAVRSISASQHIGGEVIVVDSNHDNALRRWLREADYRYDPKNALFFLRAQLAVYEAIANGIDFHLLEWAYQQNETVGVRFLREDESFVLCPDKSGGIEAGMHGDLGPNGGRGSRVSFAKMGRKANIGHSHSAGITDGIYQTGVSATLDLGYNRGPSSWSHSHIVTYPNGKRAIVTIWKGKWRA